MSFFEGMPVWMLALSIYLLRVCDVSLGTLRTLAVVQGRLKMSVIVGFVEVLIWICGVSQVMLSVREHPIVAVAFAAGFATGNAVGILLERLIAMGSVSLTIISPAEGPTIAERLRSEGQPLTTFSGTGRDGPVTMIYTTCSRRSLRKLLTVARKVDPRLFYTVEPLREWRLDARAQPFPHTTGWRSLFQRK